MTILYNEMQFRLYFDYNDDNDYNYITTNVFLWIYLPDRLCIYVFNFYKMS